MNPCFARLRTTVYREPHLISMSSSLPRARKKDAISYGCIGRCTTVASTPSASRLLTLRRSPIARTSHSRLLVYEHTQAITRTQVLPASSDDDPVAGAGDRLLVGEDGARHVAEAARLDLAPQVRLGEEE